MKQFLFFNEQGSCYKYLCELFNIFWCFRFENWYDKPVLIVSIFIDKIDSPNSKIDNYRLLTPNSFIDFYRISKKLIDLYRLLSNVIDYRCYRMTTPGILLLEIDPCPRLIIVIIIRQTHYEKSDWSRAFNQFTIACELDI